ncbi:penicillin-binding protein activator [Pseudogemmobacter blasticus]|uniref:Penicillin-binding protein activator n=1 Tax=Fuscovulum blasticum DSM 2131 TaxID=1188250 RepID=A0A2T4JCX7_FUSBL|nr:penicillin-binding protein activator [Fuscovulum blasticum]AWD21400.1 penicillin-binding protein activator [Fuscovulum blasticum]PTE15668.1 penicillin-binding protein activator [Fuscovulum blasticum DSM 2131]
MLSAMLRARKSLGHLLVVFFGLFLAACVPGGEPMSASGSGGSGKKVQVALLVPGGSSQSTDAALAKALENAARLAVADLSGVSIDLRVYNTAGQPAQAVAMAQKAADEGAQVILGPVFAEEANAVGVAMAPRGISVLAFSNNPAIAGGNVFVLGPTFDNTARRLASYAVRSGKRQVMIVHDRNTAGTLGRDAIQRGVTAAGGNVVAIASYEFSQNGVSGAAPGIVQTAREKGANAVFLTADTAGALPLLSQLLVDNGLDTGASKFVGLTRWDIPAQTLGLPSLQGGWFALPDPGLYAQFQSRYQSAYGAAPHPIAGLAYDGIAAIGALARQGRDISAGTLTQGAGFAGVSGIFRFRSDGTNERGLAVAEIRNNQVVVIDPAPRSFAGAGL